MISMSFCKELNDPPPLSTVFTIAQYNEGLVYSDRTVLEISSLTLFIRFTTHTGLPTQDQTLETTVRNHISIFPYIQSRFFSLFAKSKSSPIKTKIYFTGLWGCTPN